MQSAEEQMAVVLQDPCSSKKIYKDLECTLDDKGKLQRRASWGSIWTNNANYSDLVHFYCHNVSKRTARKSSVYLIGKIRLINHHNVIYKVMISENYDTMTRATPWMSQNQACLLFIARRGDIESLRCVLEKYNDFKQIINDKDEMRKVYGDKYTVFEEMPMYLIVIDNDYEKVLDSRNDAKFYQNYFAILKTHALGDIPEEKEALGIDIPPFTDAISIYDGGQTNANINDESKDIDFKNIDLKEIDESVVKLKQFMKGVVLPQMRMFDQKVIQEIEDIKNGYQKTFPSSYNHRNAVSKNPNDTDKTDKCLCLICFILLLLIVFVAVASLLH